MSKTYRYGEVFEVVGAVGEGVTPRLRSSFRNSMVASVFRCPAPGAGLPAGGAECERQSSQRYQRRESRRVEHQQRAETAPADEADEHQQVVMDVAEPMRVASWPTSLTGEPERNVVFRPTPLLKRCIALLWMPRATAPRPSRMAFV